MIFIIRIQLIQKKLQELKVKKARRLNREVFYERVNIYRQSDIIPYSTLLIELTYSLSDFL